MTFHVVWTGLMITLLLAMICGGIALTQCASSPEEVTLRWLRLGALVSLSLIGTALTADILTDQLSFVMLTAGLLIALFQGCHLIAVQLGRRALQRYFSFLVVIVVMLLSWQKLIEIRDQAIEGAIQVSGQADVSLQDVNQLSFVSMLGIVSMAGVMPALIGGYLMSMLLGHAYLSSAGEMTQKPFKRLVLLLLALILLRFAVSLTTGAVPYFFQATPWQAILGSTESSGSVMWYKVMIFARYLAGFVVPIIFTWMVYDCVKRRSNQSATGILYVASVMVLVGEGVSLALLGSLGIAF